MLLFHIAADIITVGWWLKLWFHYLVDWIQPSCPHPGGFATSEMKQISSSFSLPLCFPADSISLLKAIQQCPTHWSGRGSVQCGGKWLSRGMIDLNSTMAAPKATQPPLRVMDARMSPITFSSGGKTLFHYQCRPHLSPPVAVVVPKVAERNEEKVKKLNLDI